MKNVTLGGDRLGSGKKQKVHLHGYERSTHDLSYLWRSTMSAGTLVPFLNEIGLPGDTFDIDLDCDIKTHPTLGPLFGSYKVQLDVFVTPLRLYNAFLHNNALNIGRNMSTIKLPLITLTSYKITNDEINSIDFENSQVNPSCILAYLGIRGVGTNITGTNVTRDFQCTDLLAYWDIYKNYYANKQEEIGAVIHSEVETLITTVTSIDVNDSNGSETLTQFPTLSTIATRNITNFFDVNFTGTTPKYNQIFILTDERGWIPLNEMLIGDGTVFGGSLSALYNYATMGDLTLRAWRYRSAYDNVVTQPNVVTFPLDNLDKMRMAILQSPDIAVPFNINDANLEPYNYLDDATGFRPTTVATQEGLGIKTYQSDLFNNWLNTEWIDGAGGISDVTAIDTSAGNFKIDTFNIAVKVYKMLNRIAVSDGTYGSWIETVYDVEPHFHCESPMYMGGLIKELAFQEVVSNSAATPSTGTQPLGTLAGKGIMTKKHKGGKVNIKLIEPSIVMGIISLTPRVDYSQGNKWQTGLLTIDDLHKSQLDEIGFQELITEQMGWFDTSWDGTQWVQKSAGKQPAWTNYMTNVNRTYGNFAIVTNEMFMTLNRRYEHDAIGALVDVTTYIDPAKFNFIFAETALDAQNFWTQIAVNMIVRRKMSAKVMPNL